MNPAMLKNEPENKKCILRTIFKANTISRIDLVEVTGLSPATVTKFVSELMEDKIIEEFGGTRIYRRKKTCTAQGQT